MIRSLIIMLLRLYQGFISPLTGRSCRFYPSCSEYSLQSLQKYGTIRGIALTVRRICRCHPLHPGGYDPVN